jgi:hypothetical protein
VPLDAVEVSVKAKSSAHVRCHVREDLQILKRGGEDQGRSPDFVADPVMAIKATSFGQPDDGIQGIPPPSGWRPRSRQIGEEVPRRGPSGNGILASGTPARGRASRITDPCGPSIHRPRPPQFGLIATLSTPSR